jgi:Arc/MetJ-type ribon-helix-helix transcriptional regulator
MDFIKPKGLLENTAIESWLHEQIAPAFDRLKADPSRAFTIDDIREALAVEHKRAMTAVTRRP